MAAKGQSRTDCTKTAQSSSTGLWTSRHPFVQDVSVDHCRVDVFMTKKLLNCADIVALSNGLVADKWRLRANLGRRTGLHAAVGVHLMADPKFRLRMFHGGLPRSPSPLLPPLRPRESVVGEPRAGDPTGSPRGLTASVRRGSVSRKYFLDSLPLPSYVRFLFHSGWRAECAWVGSFCGEWRRTLVFANAGRLQEKCLLLFRPFRQLNQRVMRISCILLYTCSKRPVQQNQGVSGKNVYFCILLYTFHVWPGPVLFGINGLSATDA